MIKASKKGFQTPIFGTTSPSQSIVEYTDDSALLTPMVKRERTQNDYLLADVKILGLIPRYGKSFGESERSILVSLGYSPETKYLNIINKDKINYHYIYVFCNIIIQHPLIQSVSYCEFYELVDPLTKKIKRKYKKTVDNSDIPNLSGFDYFIKTSFDTINS